MVKQRRNNVVSTSNVYTTLFQRRLTMMCPLVNGLPTGQWAHDVIAHASEGQFIIIIIIIIWLDDPHHTYKHSTQDCIAS